MSTKNKTKNLKLPQYQNDDLFDMKEVNEAYKIIDESYKEQNDNYKQAIETSTIKGAIDNLELIDARKGKRTLGEKISEIDSQLESKSDYLYNIENGIKYFNMQVYPTISFWGDSITAASETNRIGGYVFDFRNNIGLLKGIVGEGWRGVSITSGTVTTLTEGINKYIWTTNNTTSKIWLDDVFTKSKETLVEVFYTTKPNGGECEIIQNYNNADTVLATINCNGELSYEKSIKVKLVANGKLYCRCKTNNPIYINGFRQSFIKNGCLVNKIGHGGIKLRDYNEQEITATLKMNPSDLYVFALGANDSPSTEEQFLVFENLYDFAIKKAREIKPNVSILLFITCRNKNADNEKFQRYKNIFYKLAKLYNCAVVDIDAYWGGWHKALELGYMQEDDVIHPTMLGHKSMCEVLTKQLLKNPNILDKYTFDGDTIDVIDQDYTIITDNNMYEMNNVYMNFPDDSNNKNLQKIKPVKNCRSNTLPKRAELNQQVFNQDVGYPMWCNKGTTYNTDGSVNSSATWRNAYGYELRQIRAEAVSSLNGASSTEIGRLQILNTSDDRGLYVTTFNKLTGDNWYLRRIDGSFLDVVNTLPVIPTGQENKYRGWRVLLLDNSGSGTSEDKEYVYKKKNNVFQWVEI